MLATGMTIAGSVLPDPASTVAAAWPVLGPSVLAPSVAGRPRQQRRPRGRAVREGSAVPGGGTVARGGRAVAGYQLSQVLGELLDQLAADLDYDAAAELRGRPVTFIVVCMVTLVAAPEDSGSRDARTVAEAVPAPRVSLPDASTTTT